jgi:hypothetical protein
MQTEMAILNWFFLSKVICLLYGQLSIISEIFWNRYEMFWIKFATRNYRKYNFSINTLASVIDGATIATAE